MMTTIPGSKPIMLVNGVPVYPQDLPTTPISEEEVEQIAVQVTGNREIARTWMDRPNIDFEGRTPRQAVQQGEGQRAAAILRSF